MGSKAEWRWQRKEFMKLKTDQEKVRSLSNRVKRLGKAEQKGGKEKYGVIWKSSNSCPVDPRSRNSWKHWDGDEWLIPQKIPEFLNRFLGSQLRRATADLPFREALTCHEEAVLHYGKVSQTWLQTLCDNGQIALPFCTSFSSSEQQGQ